MNLKLLTFLFLISLSHFAFGQTIEIDNISYQLIQNSKAVVVQGNYEGHISIPEKITYQNRKYTVEEIGYAAFNESSGLLSVKLPNSIHTIRQRAFGDCKALKDINIPVSVTRIDASAFTNCKVLTSINIPENVAFVGQYAFSGCESLTAIEVDKNNQHFTSLDGVLYDKEIKTLIKLPDTRAFYEFPDSVTSFVTESFEGNKNITKIDLPDAVNSIPNHAFVNCSALKVFHIPANVEWIGLSAFNGCDTMESFIVDERNQHFSSVDGILYNYDKTILIKCPETKSEVTIEKSVTKIESWAFFRCKKLTEIILPENVTTIGMSAFVQCDTLKIVKILSKKQVDIQMGIFAGRKKAVTVLVPEESISFYKNSNSLDVKELNYQVY